MLLPISPIVSILVSVYVLRFSFIIFHKYFSIILWKFMKRNGKAQDASILTLSKLFVMSIFTLNSCTII